AVPALRNADRQAGRPGADPRAPAALGLGLAAVREGDRLLTGRHGDRRERLADTRPGRGRDHAGGVPEDVEAGRRGPGPDGAVRKASPFELPGRVIAPSDLPSSVQKAFAIAPLCGSMFASRSFAVAGAAIG